MGSSPKLPGVPQARQHPVLRRYPLRRLRVSVGAGQFSLVVPDERAWVRSGTWASDVVRGKEPPYWVRIWPASLAAARAIHLAGSLQGLRALDLGCGLGLPGQAAARAGAAVTFADQETDATAFACWNAAAFDAAETPRGVALDWARQTLDGVFDVILLSDVSYRTLHHEPLRRHLDACLAPGGLVLHADPHRELATRFLEDLGPGYARATWSRPTIVQDRKADVRVTLLKKAGDAAPLAGPLAAWWTRFEAASRRRSC